MFTINGKVALITGAGRGIGLDFAKVLFRNNLKAATLIDINETNGQRAVSEIEAEFGAARAIFIKADVSNRVEFEEAFETTIKTFNQLDIVINNAAIIHEVQWEKCIYVNLLGTIVGSTLALEKYLPKFKSGNDGVILNVASRAGLSPVETIPVYTATKHGVIGFSRSIGDPNRYKTSNVRVLTICPSGTHTSLLKLTSEQLQEPYLSRWYETRKDVPLQSSQEVAEHAVKIIESGSSGSVWFIRNNARSEITFKEY